jgi:hypothetical protein
MDNGALRTNKKHLEKVFGIGPIFEGSPEFDRFWILCFRRAFEKVVEPVHIGILRKCARKGGQDSVYNGQTDRRHKRLQVWFVLWLCSDPRILFQMSSALPFRASGSHNIGTNDQ